MADDKGLGIKSWLSGPRRKDAKAESSDSLVLDRYRVAVLPFTNLSSSPEDGYFADGMTEELITSLSGVRQLTVIARTSVMKYKGSQKSAADVGRELNAGTLIEGSVRKAGSKVRITAQLIDAATEGHIWARNYDRQLEDVFEIQSEIAEKVAGELRIRLLDNEKRIIEKIPTANTEAYAHFLEGRELVRAESEPSLRKALVLLEKAVEEDPSFAKAHTTLADCLLLLANGSYEPYEQAVGRARLSLKTALDLDPELADAHSTLSTIHILEDRLGKSEDEAKRALELNPSLPEPYRDLANLAMIKGNSEEGLKLWEAVYRLDPIRPVYIERLGSYYFYLGRESEALQLWEKTAPIAPAGTFRNLTEYSLWKNDIGKAKEYFSKAETLEPKALRGWVDWMRGYIAAVSGDKDTAFEAIRTMEGNQSGRLLSEVGFVYHGLGDLDSYFRCVNKSIDSHSLAIARVLYCPLFARSRQDPRYAKLLERVKELT